MDSRNGVNKIYVNFIRSSSFLYTLTRNYFDWDQYNLVIPGLWIGKLPTNDGPVEGARDFDSKLIAKINRDTPDLPLKLVVSVVEENELNGEGFYLVETIKPDQWKINGINHHLLEMVDFTADVDIKEAVETITVILRVLEEKKHSVYVHCKAGRSRSAMICAIVLALIVEDPETKNKITLQTAIEFLTAQRKQVDIDEDKQKIAARILELFNCLNNLLEYVSQGFSLSGCLSGLESEKRDWMIYLLSSQYLSMLVKDQHEFEAICKIISPVACEYLVNQLYKSNNPPFGICNDKRYEEAALKEIINKLVSIIKSEQWKDAGFDVWSRAKKPTGIAQMFEFCCDKDIHSMNADQLRSFLTELTKKFKSENSPNRSPKSSRFFNYFSDALSQKICRKNITKGFYNLINVIAKNVSAKSWCPHLFVDQLNSYYKTHVNPEMDVMQRDDVDGSASANPLRRSM